MGGDIRKIVALDGADPTFEHEANLIIVCLNIGGLHVDKLMRHGRRSVQVHHVSSYSVKPWLLDAFMTNRY